MLHIHSLIRSLFIIAFILSNVLCFLSHITCKRTWLSSEIICIIDLMLVVELTETLGYLFTIRPQVRESTHFQRLISWKRLFLLAIRHRLLARLDLKRLSTFGAKHGDFGSIQGGEGRRLDKRTPFGLNVVGEEGFLWLRFWLQQLIQRSLRQ